MQDDPLHPIIERPHEHRIQVLSLHVEPDQEEPYLDLHLEREGVVRRLRFFSPRNIEVGEGFPASLSWIAIYDVSASQLDGLSVHVDDFDDGLGPIRFWAREVIDLDQR